MNGNLADAEKILRLMNTHTAEWYFLMGSIYHRKGWYDEAFRSFQMACNIEPNNEEYRRAFMAMQGSATAYRQYGSPAYGGETPCACCAEACCASALCNCCSGCGY